MGGVYFSLAVSFFILSEYLCPILGTNELLRNCYIVTFLIRFPAFGSKMGGNLETIAFTGAHYNNTAVENTVFWTHHVTRLLLCNVHLAQYNKV